MAPIRMYTERNRRAVLESLEQRQLLDAGGVLAAEVAEGEGEQPDFHLIDVNSTSSTYNQLVSPRDYLDKISVWYFIHST